MTFYEKQTKIVEELLNILQKPRNSLSENELLVNLLAIL